MCLFWCNNLLNSSCCTLKLHNCHDTIWQARVYEQPCSSSFRCIWGNKTVTTPLPDIVTTTKLPDTTTPMSTTTKLPYTTPKPNPVNYGGTILWVLTFLGGFVLIGAMFFFYFWKLQKNHLKKSHYNSIWLGK